MEVSQHFNIEGSLTSSLVFTEMRVTCSAFKDRNQGKMNSLKKKERFTFDTIYLFFRNCTASF